MCFLLKTSPSPTSVAAADKTRAVTIVNLSVLFRSMFVFTLLVFALLAAAAIANRCDDGWRYSPHSGKCYKFYNTDSSWALAEFKCYFNGGHHVSVHNYYDNQFIRELARGSKTLWLGNAQFGKSVNYVWTDHSPYNYESWPHGIRPPRISGRQCTKMNVSTGEWFQSCCKVPSPYICQKDAKQESKTSYDSYYQSLKSNSITSHNNDRYQKYGKATEFRRRYFL